jgi:cell division protein FtsL
VAALRKNRLLTGYMIMAVLLTCMMLVGYVSLQTNVTTRMGNIANLENQLSTVNADNKATESRIATNTNLSDIKDRAINELGMQYATSNQIVYYSVDGSDYMSQYKDIP